MLSCPTLIVSPKFLKATKKASTAKKIPLSGDPTDFFRILNLENMLHEQFTSIQYCTKRLTVRYYFEEGVLSTT